MPHPLPEYTPDEIASEIEALGLKGLTHYSLHKGLKRNRLIHLFSSDRHPQLKSCYDLSRFCGITLDELARIAKNGEFPDFITTVLWSKQIKTVTDLERQAGLGRDVIRQRLTYPRWQAFLEYAETAEAIGWSLEKLAQHLFRSKEYTNAS